MYGINHGYTPAQVSSLVCRDGRPGLTRLQKNRVFDIADVPFSQVDADEVRRYPADMANAGNYEGYKGRKVWVRHCLRALLMS